MGSGRIDELDLMHLTEKSFFEVKTQKDHLHLASFRCGEIEEFDSPTFHRLEREIAAPNDFEVQVMRLEVGGLCWPPAWKINLRAHNESPCPQRAHA